MGEQGYPIHKLTSVGWRRCESDIHIHIHTMCIAIAIATATELLAREAMYSYPLTLTCTAPPVPRPLQYRFQLNCCSLTTILHGTTLRCAVLRCATVCCGLVWCVVWSGVCLSPPRSAAALMNRMPNGHEMLTPDTSPDATAPFRGPYEGEIWYNKNLAATFREVAANGKDGYYKGRIAKEIVKVLGDMGGVMTEEDLANHYVRCTLHAAARCTREGT